MNSETSWVTLRSLSLSHFTFSFSFSTWRPVPPFPHLLIHAHLNIHNHIYDKTHLSLESNQHIQRTHLYFSSIVEKKQNVFLKFSSFYQHPQHIPPTHTPTPLHHENPFSIHPKYISKTLPFLNTPKTYLQNFTV